MTGTAARRTAPTSSPDRESCPRFRRPGRATPTRGRRIDIAFCGICGSDVDAYRKGIRTIRRSRATNGPGSSRRSRTTSTAWQSGTGLPGRASHRAANARCVWPVGRRTACAGRSRPLSTPLPATAPTPAPSTCPPDRWSHCPTQSPSNRARWWSRRRWHCTLICNFHTLILHF